MKSLQKKKLEKKQSQQEDGENYKEKLLEVYKYDKLIETGKIALYFVNDPKGNYMFWLNNFTDLKAVDMYCPDTTLWTKKKVLKPCYLIDESQASIINLNGFKK